MKKVLVYKTTQSSERERERETERGYILLHFPDMWYNKESFQSDMWQINSKPTSLSKPSAEMNQNVSYTVRVCVDSFVILNKIILKC